MVVFVFFAFFKKSCFRTPRDDFGRGEVNSSNSHLVQKWHPLSVGVAWSPKKIELSPCSSTQKSFETHSRTQLSNNPSPSHLFSDTSQSHGNSFLILLSSSV